MTLDKNLVFFGTVPLLSVAGFLWIRSIGRRLSKNHPSDVLVILYLFSLTLTAGFLVAWWARDSGAIDAAGQFHGTAGAAIGRLLTFIFDAPGELKLLGAIFALVVAPQVLTNVLIRPFRCKAPRIWVDGISRFVYWSLLKSLVIGAGVIFVYAVCGWIGGWDGISATRAALLADGALFALGGSFWMAFIYRDVTETIAPSAKASFVELLRVFHNANGWANRRITPKNEIPH